MFAELRDRIAASLSILAQRVSSEPRYPGAARVPQTIRTLAGVPITPDTAVTIAAVWACLRYLTQTVAVLPWHVMRDGRNGAEIAKTHPIDWLVWRRVSPEWSSFQFRETMLHWALRYGNGYAEIERDQLGRPLALWPIPPYRVLVVRDVDTQELVYRVTNSDTSDASSMGSIDIAAMDMFHVRGFGEGPVGVNVVAYAAESLGWAKAVQLFGASFFGNSMTPSSAIINKKALRPEAFKRQKAELEQLYKGPRNANKTIILDNDSDIKAISIDAQKSQLVEIQQHLVEEVARWFGVPPHKIQHLMRSTFNNIEHQSIEVVVDSISPWVKRFEDEADYKLFGQQNRQGFYTKMNMNALMRGDHAARGEFYKTMVSIGAMSPNRVLELEDENTIGPDGDIHVMQNQNVTLETIAAGPPEAPAAGSTSPSPGTASPMTAGERAAAQAIIAMDADARVNA